LKALSIVLFTTSNCIHCPSVKQALTEIAAERGEEVNLKIWEIDKNPKAMQIARDWGISGVPTILLLINGEEIGKVVGSQPKERINDIIQRCIQSYVFQEPPPRGDDSSSSVLRNTSKSADVREGSDQNRNREGVEL
jgi:thioredoxin-like negative regulator of GroEL